MLGARGQGHRLLGQRVMLAALVGIDCPIVQAPMAGVQGARLGGGGQQRRRPGFAAGGAAGPGRAA